MPMTSSALAEVTEVTISPENPKSGDTITVSGKASPGEEVGLSISFDKTQAVSDGKFEYDMGKVTIPDIPGSSSFSLRAEGVDDLDLSLKLFGIPVPVSDSFITYNGDVASFGTGKISSGTYDVTIAGASSLDEVSLSFGAKGSLNADENGDFSYSYTANNVPEGDFSYNVGGQSGTIPFGTSSSGDSSGDSSSSSSSSKKKSSSHTGTEYKIVPADTLIDNDEDTGVGEDAEGEDAESKFSDSSESLESSVDSDYQEGYVMTDQATDNEKISTLSAAGLIIGAICIGAIFIGYRKNKFK